MSEIKCECPARKALGSAIEALEEVFDALGTNRAKLDARDFMKAARAALSASCPCEELREMSHARNCPMLNPMSDDFCTCGLVYRVHLQTEREMHAAWRKRAEQAETERDQLRAQVKTLLNEIERITNDY